MSPFSLKWWRRAWPLEGLLRAPQRRDPLKSILADLVVAARITVHAIEPKRHQLKGKIPDEYDYEPVEAEAVQNEIAALDEEGQAYITGIPRAGECKVCFYERDDGA